MQPAPFFDTIAEAPSGASAYWVTATDGVRLRIALLTPRPVAAKGTVLLFPGRTEYVEKYGPAGADFLAHGYACLTIDWRGQGLADRPLDDQATGHVGQFSEYQADVREMVRVATELDLPRPWFLVAHSMGGAIGLRSLHEGLPVAAAVFTGPMWGIVLPTVFRPIARLLATLSHSVGFGHAYVPTTRPETYVLEAAFDDNTLTTDPGMYDWMQRQLLTHPELALGGPSMTWLKEALKEVRSLRGLPAPDLPCLTWVGSNERIVEINAIRQLMSSWTNGTLTEVPGGEHEVMMEPAAIRTEFFAACAELFERHHATGDD